MMGSFLIKLNTGPPKTHPSKFFAALPNLSIRAKSYANQCKLFKPTVVSSFSWHIWTIYDLDKSLVLPDWDVKRVHVFQIPQHEDKSKKNLDVTKT